MSNVNNDTTGTTTATTEAPESKPVSQSKIDEMHGRLSEFFKAAEANAALMPPDDAIKSFAKGMAGKEKLQQRIAVLCACLTTTPDKIKATAAGVPAVEAAMFALRDNKTETLDELKKKLKAKEVEPPAPNLTALALSKTTEFHVVASSNLQQLEKTEVGIITSAAAVAYFFAAKILAIPAGVNDFLQLLIAASGGNYTEPFSISDTQLAGMGNVSRMTIIRQRQKLIDYMRDTQNGIVSIMSGTDEKGVSPTKYRLHLLDNISNAVTGLMQSGNASIEMFRSIAELVTVDPKGNIKISADLPDNVLQGVAGLEEAVTTAIKNVPKPKIDKSAGSTASELKALNTKAEKLIQKGTNNATEAEHLGNAELSGVFTTLSGQCRNLYSAIGAEGAVADRKAIDEYKTKLKSIEDALEENGTTLAELRKTASQSARDNAKKAAATGEATLPYNREFAVNEVRAMKDPKAELNAIFQSLEVDFCQIFEIGKKLEMDNPKLFVRIQALASRCLNINSSVVAENVANTDEIPE